MIASIQYTMYYFTHARTYRSNITSEKWKKLSRLRNRSKILTEEQDFSKYIGDPHYTVVLIHPNVFCYSSYSSTCQ